MEWKVVAHLEDCIYYSNAIVFVIDLMCMFLIISVVLYNLFGVGYPLLPVLCVSARECVKWQVHDLI